MGLSTDLFIGGEWVKGPSVMPVMDPALGEVIAEVSIAGPAEIEAATAAAPSTCIANNRGVKYRLIVNYCSGSSC